MKLKFDRSRGLLACLALTAALLACGRNQAGQPAPAAGAASQATFTSVPTPLPLLATPAELPADNERRDLIRYANAVLPLMAQATPLLEHDGAILNQAQDGQDELLCDGRLAADNVAMKAILGQMQGVSPPAAADRVHDLLLKSGDSWTGALDDVASFCSSGNALYKVSAGAKFYQAALTFQDAGNRFWLLVMSQGIEAWVQR